jgi:hypothetical protein
MIRVALVKRDKIPAEDCSNHLWVPTSQGELSSLPVIMLNILSEGLLELAD